MNQQIIKVKNDYDKIDGILKEKNIKSIFLVCDSAFSFLKISTYLDSLEKRKGIRIVKFQDFQPNPSYESVEEGVELFNNSNCDLIMAVGGGSAIDVAKCIKLFSNMESTTNYLDSVITPNNIPIFAVPTTAGTGSESTKFAVIYYQGEKQSITNDNCIPSVVIMDPSVLETLPMYQKKSTMLDALCHSLESFWSINSTDESIKYSKEALTIILENKDKYLENDKNANERMLIAANIAGKAINITQTTAGHAMSYKLTSLYGIAHGHAVALCDAKLIPFMIKNINLCIDKRGEDYLSQILNDIASIMHCSLSELGDTFEKIVKQLDLEVPKATKEDYQVLVKSVNQDRLKNYPVRLSEESIDYLYHEILC